MTQRPHLLEVRRRPRNSAPNAATELTFCRVVYLAPRSLIAVDDPG